MTSDRGWIAECAFNRAERRHSTQRMRRVEACLPAAWEVVPWVRPLVTTVLVGSHLAGWYGCYGWPGRPLETPKHGSTSSTLQPTMDRVRRVRKRQPPCCSQADDPQIEGHPESADWPGTCRAMGWLPSVGAGPVGFAALCRTSYWSSGARGLALSFFSSSGSAIKKNQHLQRDSSTMQRTLTSLGSSTSSSSSLARLEGRVGTSSTSSTSATAGASGIDGASGIAGAAGASGVASIGATSSGMTSSGVFCLFEER